MPKRSLRLCAAPGCRELVPFGRCRKCQQKIKPKRDVARQRLYGRKWRAARARHLAGEPWCRQHLKDELGHVPANEVDHIIPHHGDVEIFWDESNWQSLCKSCHSAKTAREVGFIKS